METILSIFQQKFALVKVFNILPLHFWPKKISCMLKECFKIFLKLARKIWRFFYSSDISQSIQASNLASEYDVTQLEDLQIYVQK